MTRLILVPALLALSSCSKTPEPDVSSTPPPIVTAHDTTGAAGKAHGAASAAGAAGAGQEEVAWDGPAKWPKVENRSPMRKATYNVPRVAGDAEDGELVVAQAGGSVDQNVTRWAGQFAAKPEAVKRRELRAGGFKVTVVEIHGPYTGMQIPGVPASGPKPGFALLGAIVETSPPTFFKLTGPEKTVVAARKDFDALVASLRAK